ncbi:MAG: hypothetical protein KOO61_00140 [Spirochaetales bacterium]|nr:hypothetical protein [Spirochaetales bacterium]
MKMSPEYTKAQANMQPGVITSDGFLGNDERPIVEIIADDEAEMKRASLEFDETVALMRHLLNESRKGLGEPVTVDGKWIVQAFEARGFLASPFEDGIFRKINAKVTLIHEGEPTEHSILYSDLSLHLIEKRHFFQGKGGSFRISPAAIKRVLFAD